ncbi:hypothetical protein PHLH5_25580 [Pseudomonas sp. Cab53]|nr:hypothetical protein PHLH5_25580 [Pseudomonas sp. Cab53]
MNIIATCSRQPWNPSLYSSRVSQDQRHRSHGPETIA